MWPHLNRPSLTPEVQLSRKWIFFWGLLVGKLQLGESRIFHRAKLLLLMMEKIRDFLQKFKIIKCWSMNPSFLLQFLKLFVDVMTLRYFVLLSCSLMSLFRSNFVIKSWFFKCFSCQLFQKGLSYFDFSKTWRCLAQQFQSFKLVPSSLKLRRRWLKFHEIGIPSHLQMYLFGLLSSFCTIKVFERWYIVRSHLSLL